MRRRGPRPRRCARSDVFTFKRIEAWINIPADRYNHECSYILLLHTRTYPYILIYFSCILIDTDRQTDGRTDGRTICTIHMNVCKHAAQHRTRSSCSAQPKGTHRATPGTNQKVGQPSLRAEGCRAAAGAVKLQGNERLRVRILQDADLPRRSTVGAWYGRGAARRCVHERAQGRARDRGGFVHGR